MSFSECLATRIRGRSARPTAGWSGSTIPTPMAVARSASARFRRRTRPSATTRRGDATTRSSPSRPRRNRRLREDHRRSSPYAAGRGPRDLRGDRRALRKLGAGVLQPGPRRVASRGPLRGADPRAPRGRGRWPVPARDPGPRSVPGLRVDRIQGFVRLPSLRRRRGGPRSPADRDLHARPRLGRDPRPVVPRERRPRGRRSRRPGHFRR